jgi:flavin reductase (DIM6/NTAB) family NADH-FMN oxidoreductase RutF
MAGSHSNFNTGSPGNTGGRGAPGAGLGAGVANEELVRGLLAKLGTGGVEFVMTSRHETSRLGVVVRRVMACADTPMSVCVALMKGHPISPLIRDSHSFALCAMDDGDRMLAKVFERVRGGVVSENGQSSGILTPARMGDPASDPFIAMEVESLETGSPIIKRCGWALDCRVLMHLDFETDHEMYIGAVVGGWAPSKQQSSKAAKHK